MTAILFLALAIVLAALPPRPVLAGTAVLAALWAGTTLPDLDGVLGLGHRSGLTHGLLPALVAFAAGPRERPVAAGLALGTGLHLAADAFPHAMRGYATVKLPAMGSIGWAASYGWLGLSAAALLVAGTVLAARMPYRLALLGMSALLGVLYLLHTDGGWWALSALGLAGGGVAGRRRGRPA